MAEEQLSASRAGEEMPTYYDRYGQEQPWSALVAQFGEIVVHRAPAEYGDVVWRCVALIERAPIDAGREGQVAGWLRQYRAVVAQLVGKLGTREAATVIVRHEYADGSPVTGLRAAWYWPDAPEDPACGPAGGVPAGMTPGRCVSGLTNAEGLIGHAMGEGAYYWPDQGQIGPHAIWVYGAAMPSDVVLGLGMLPGTNHEHLDAVMRQMRVVPPVPPPEPPPEPPPDPIEAELAAIEGSVARIREILGHQRALAALAMASLGREGE